ncbi:MAG: ChuX/HutX family heme-like substrate-binding protein, partial [Bauldia litoralis]
MEMQTRTNVPDIFAAAGALRADQPRLRARDLADRLGVSEAELVEAQAEGIARRIDGTWSDLIREVEGLGPVMALTRNESAVHEKTGVYDKVSSHGMMGLALGADIDLRLFYGNWKYAFAVHTQTDSGPRRSLQFFGGDGA